MVIVWTTIFGPLVSAVKPGALLARPSLGLVENFHDASVELFP